MGIHQRKQLAMGLIANQLASPAAQSITSAPSPKLGGGSLAPALKAPAAVLPKKVSSTPAIKPLKGLGVKGKGKL
jgi:hypothetical protein